MPPLPSEACRPRPDIALVPDVASAPDTPDGPPDPPPCAPLPARPAPPAMRRRIADALYILLMGSGWLALNVLAVAGCAVIAFAIFGGGNWEASFLQIDNLTSRYLAADAGRRAQFHHHAVQIFSTVLLALVVFRLPAFVRRVRRDLAEAGAP